MKCLLAKFLGGKNWLTHVLPCICMLCRYQTAVRLASPIWIILMLNHDPISTVLSHILCYIHHLHTPPTLTTNKKTQAPPEIFQNLTGYPTQPNPQNPPNSTPSTAPWPCFRSTPRVAISRSHFRDRNIRRARNGNPSPPGWSLPQPNQPCLWRCFKVYAFVLLPRPSPKKSWCGFWERINYNF